MANFIRPLPTECLGYTSWPLRSSKEIPLFEDVTERTCSHSSLGCLGIHSRVRKTRVLNHKPNPVGFSGLTRILLGKPGEYQGLKGKGRIPTDDLIPKNRLCRNHHLMTF